jgi:hypothetical protein
MGKNVEIEWLKKPADKDYAAAENFLQLLYRPKQAALLRQKLERAKMSEYAAKDILRASGASMPEIQAFDWTKQHKKIKRGAPLSPILLVRRDNGGQLIVADGFHRMCAVFMNDEEVSIPCKIV